MVFIPPASSPTVPPSPRTREMANLLTRVLEEYRKSHPSTTDTEIRAAVRLARLASRSGNPAVPGILAVSVGLLVAGVLAGLFVFLRSAEGVEIGAGSPMIIMGVVFVLLVFLMAVKVKNR
jgi:hypothetical protein